MSQAKAKATQPSLQSLALVMAMLMGTAGCQAGTGPWSRWFSGQSARNNPADDAVSRNLMNRWIDHGSPGAAEIPGASATAEDPDARGAGILRLGSRGWFGGSRSVDDSATAAEFQEAEKLYLQGEVDEAEKLFTRIARKEKSPIPKLFSDFTNPSLDKSIGGSPWGMKALYYLGEIKFQKGDYVGAHDKFEELVKQYPGTNYLEKAVAREYEIGQIWLSQGTEGNQAPMPWNARFSGGLPLVDAWGHGVAALDHVRMNDPTGPLADDATMAIADHYYKTGNFELAAEYYDQMSTEHEKSPMLQRAMLASIDAKMKGYIGPEYDATGLEQARDSAQRVMQLFPERLASTDGNEDLYQTIDLIADQEAERAYSVGSYYRRAGKVISAEYYFGMIVQKWPKSTWAEKSREQLTELAKMPRKESTPSKIMVQPGASDPFQSGIGSSTAGQLGSMGLGGLGGP